ncbi:MAG: aminotransferase class V-fold PLP-dependent enzyme [Gemmatimonadetes bacterium]|nr:aminotransferase class V-fold PLP-dependent enzyme [Gemmatimonadota bacterium]
MKRFVEPDDFPASRKCVYLNAASVALMYGGAKRAVVEWQEDLAENGTIHFDEAAEESVFENLHVAAAGLFHAHPDDIAVASSASELMCSLAWALVPGRETNVVSTGVTFPSTLYPWSRVARHTGCEIRLARGRGGYVDPDELVELIDDRTAVVAVCHVEFSTGQTYDLARLVEACHSRGALLVVDATQSAGAVPLDVRATAVDAVVTAGYKWLCGPFGVGVLYLAPHLQGRLDPGLVGWRSHKEMWDLPADRLEFPGTARRFEFSTIAYGCAIGLARSVEYLLGLGVDRICAHNRRLADLLARGLRERGAEIIASEGGGERSSIVAARFPGKKESSAVAKYLNDAGIVVSGRRGFVRFSPHLYNEAADIEESLACIEAALA